MNEAFARAAGDIRRAKQHHRVAVTTDTEHRMRDQQNIEAAVGDFTHHRIDQKRHVVIGDFDDGHRLTLAGCGERHGLATDLGLARRSRFKIIEGALGQPGEIVGAVSQHVARYRPVEKLGDKARRDVIAMPIQRDASLFDEGADSLLFRAAETLGGYLVEHGNLADLEIRRNWFDGESRS